MCGILKPENLRQESSEKGHDETLSHMQQKSVLGYFAHRRLLSGLSWMIILGPCRSMNFIVGNVRRTARYLSGQASGRGRNVRTAVRRSCPKSFPRSLRPLLEKRLKHPRAAARLIPAACVARANRIGIELLTYPSANLSG